MTTIDDVYQLERSKRKLSLLHRDQRRDVAAIMIRDAARLEDDLFLDAAELWIQWAHAAEWNTPVEIETDGYVVGVVSARNRDSTFIHYKGIRPGPYDRPRLKMKAATIEDLASACRHSVLKVQPCLQCEEGGTGE